MINSKKITIIPIILGILIVCLIIASCSSPKKETKTINIGYLPIYVDLPLFVAREKGFFEKRGIQVKLSRFESSPEISTAIINGNIDAAASVATSSVLSLESRDPNKIKAFLVDAENKENYLSSIVVLKNSGIKTIQDLKGKKIGSFPGPSALTFGRMVFEKFGIDPQKDINFIELASNTHLSSLETGTVDALFTYEPISTQAVLQKNAVKLIPGAVETYILNPWQAGVWILNYDFTNKNPELSKAFILAIYDALDYIRANPEASKEALIPYTAITMDVAKATPNIPFTKLGEVNLDALQKQSDILLDKKVINKKIDVNNIMLATDFLTR